MRLLICMLIALAPIVIIARRVRSWSDRLANDAPRAMMGFWVEVAGILVVALLLMAVRLWFDIAQVHAVAENETAMGRALVHSLRLTFANFATLFWIYLRISLIAWAFSAAALWGWIQLVRPEWIGVSLLLSQAVLLVWLGARLWQRARAPLWYQHNRPAPPPPWERWWGPRSLHGLTSAWGLGADSHWKAAKPSDPPQRPRVFSPGTESSSEPNGQ